MDFIFLALGGLLYFVAVIDIIKTTLSMHGGGWITSPLSHAVWMLFLKLSGGNGRSRLLEHVGYLLLVFIIAFWVISLWGSFFLLLLSEADSVVNSTTRESADAWQKLYYAGFAFSTLGVGDYVASSNLWRIITDVYAFTGLVLITTSVTYFVPVLSGVILQRNLGITLCSLGQSPQQLVLNSWDGRSFNRLVSQASSISNTLIQHSQNHKGYPVIHYFHTKKAKNAVILRITTLYEALLILNKYVKEDLRPSQQDISSLHTALENYIEVITEVASVNKVDRAPASPKLEQLKANGLINPDAEGTAIDEESQQKRRLLASLVKQDGWTWQDVTEGP